MGYDFKEELYPEVISYANSKSLFTFFDTKEQTKEFFKYFYSRVMQEHKLFEKGETEIVHVLRNDNDREPLIDFNYNFFIEVLGEWVEHYCSVKSYFYSYTAYKYSEYTKKEEESLSRFREYRDFFVDLPMKQRVILDYSYSGFIIKRTFNRDARYNFIQVFLNNILGKHTYVQNYSRRKTAKVVSVVLVKDEKNNEYIKFPSVSFVRSTLAHYLSAIQMKKLKEIGDFYKILSKDYKGVQAKIKELNVNENDIKYCNIFEIKELENYGDTCTDGWLPFEEKEETNK